MFGIVRTRNAETVQLSRTQIGQKNMPDLIGTFRNWNANVLFGGLAILAICALAVYLCAHHNWHRLPAGTTIDRIVVEKSARKLSVFRDGRHVKAYRIALGRNPVGPKQEEGDMKTPEGIYKIDGRNPQSSFHLALHISYPSEEDNSRAAARGVSAG